MKTTASENNYEKWPQRPAEFARPMTPAILSDGNGGFTHYPELMTEDELIVFLRIAEISNSKNYHNVIEHLKKFRGLPRVHICRRALYPQKAVLKWIEKETDVGK